ncbi:MAG: alpha/beta hydrolase [Bacteroidota bacterium]
MQKSKISGSFGELTYNIHQGGKEILLAFHGFGQNGEALLPLIQSLLPDYTIFSFNLFFHGSIWKLRDKPLEKNVWEEILNSFFTKHNIGTFTLLGFSLGAKISLVTYTLFPDRVSRMVLLAPDGISTNLWYNLATYPHFFRDYFKSMIVQPKRFYSILNALTRMNLVDRGLIRFAANQMNTASKRHKVYYSWVVYRRFQLSQKELILLANKSNCKFTFWLGTYDKVITKERIQSFAQKLPNSEVRVLDCGHNDLIQKAAYALSD